MVTSYIYFYKCFEARINRSMFTYFSNTLRNVAKNINTVSKNNKIFQTVAFLNCLVRILLLNKNKKFIQLIS